MAVGMVMFSWSDNTAVCRTCQFPLEWGLRQVLPGALTALTALYPLLFVALWSKGLIGARFGLPDAEPLTFLSLR